MESKNTCTAELAPDKGSWEDNSIQFPRLIAEIIATQDIDFQALADAMDLSIEDVSELMLRAQLEWDRIVNNT